MGLRSQPLRTVLKKCRNEFECIVYENAFYTRTQIVTEHSIGLDSPDSYVIVKHGQYGGHIELIRFKEYYRMPRGHEHISFVFLSAFRDIFSQSFLRVRL